MSDFQPGDVVRVTWVGPDVHGDVGVCDDLFRVETVHPSGRPCSFRWVNGGGFGCRGFGAGELLAVDKVEVNQ